MTGNRQQIAAKIAGEALTLAQQVIQQNGNNAKTGRNSLRNSALQQQAESKAEKLSGGSIVIRILFNNYIRYIEQGRKPREGKMPPVDALRDWASKNGIPADNNTLWAIAYAIWRDGYAGRPILAILEKEIDKKWSENWADELLQPLIDEIGRIFEIKGTV